MIETLLILGAAAIWFVGFLGGRTIGYTRGYIEGVEAGIKESNAVADWLRVNKPAALSPRGAQEKK